MANPLDPWIKATHGNRATFCKAAGVPPGIMWTLQKQEPISKANAEKICKHLSDHFRRPIEVDDIVGLKVWESGNTTEDLKVEGVLSELLELLEHCESFPLSFTKWLMDTTRMLETLKMTGHVREIYYDHRRNAIREVFDRR